MSRTPWYRWFPSDFGGSIKVKGMSDLAELVYRRLLDALWESKDCLLPEDLPFLHRVLLPSRPFSEFEAVWSELTRPGFEVITRPVEGMISNRRISYELEDTRAMIEKKRAAGKLGAQKRWGNDPEPETDGNDMAPAITPAMAPAMAEGITDTWQEGSHPHPHPQPDKRKGKTPPTPPSRWKSKFTPPSGQDLQEARPWLNARAWDEWVKFRKELGKPLKTQVGVSQQLNFLQKHQHDHVDILNQSMKNEWQGLFELKDKEAGNGNGTHRSTSRIERNKAAADEAIRRLQGGAGQSGKPADSPCLDVACRTTKA